MKMRLCCAVMLLCGTTALFFVARVASGQAAAGGNTPAANSGAAIPPIDNKNFIVMGKIPAGETLFWHLQQAAGLEDVIRQTADTLAPSLDAKPEIVTAFADSQTKTKGGAEFKTTIKGIAVKGFIFAEASGGAGDASIIVASPSVSKDDVSTLMGFLPDDPKLTTFNFPDNSGSIDLPDGWKTGDQGTIDGFFVAGPRGEGIVVGRALQIIDPNGAVAQKAEMVYRMQLNNYNFALQRYRQMEQFHAQNPNFPAPMPPTAPTPPDLQKQLPWAVICPPCNGPRELMEKLMPILDARGKAAAAKNGGKYGQTDKIDAIIDYDVNPSTPDVRGGCVVYDWSTYQGDQLVEHRRTLEMVYTSPLPIPGMWAARFYQINNRADQFLRELPLMLRIMNSTKIHEEVVDQQVAQRNQQTREIGEQQTQMILQRGRDFQQEQDEQFHDFEGQMQAQEQARHDAASDYIEYIGGVRDVMDTSTGQMTQVDLFNRDAIVDFMNSAAGDPNRFVQIPLRYER